ncbi:MAG: glycoside hydrolase family 26 protein [Bacteroidota bacterium]
MKRASIRFLPFLLLLVFFSCTSKDQEKTGTILPNDPSATEETVNLYQNLHALAGKSVLIGHQDDLAYGIGWKGDEFRSDINDVCGQFPAVFGWDLGKIGTDYNIDSVPFASMKVWAVKAYQKGGINTYSWHMDNLSTGGNSWDITPSIMDILPGGKKHEAYLQQLDLVAGFFASLTNDDGTPVPIVFRPFHEMNGGWFWWGAASCTPEEYKRLYRFTVEYLRDTKNLHHIIYAFSTDVFTSVDEYLRYYPGDEYVDILGFDDYRGLKNKENSYLTVRMLETLDSLSSARSKIFTISETGLERITDPNWFTGVVLPVLKTNESTQRASWMLLWRNGRPDHFYAPYPGQQSADDFIVFAADSLTGFLNDNRSFYSAADNKKD